MYYKTDYSSPVGKITSVSSEEGLIGLWIEGQKYAYNSLKREAVIEDDNFAVLLKTKEWLDDYFAGLRPEPESLPLAPIGTKFQHDVWDILLKIPYGEVTTYGAIAKQIAEKYSIEKMSAQAVGGAVGHNQLSIIIPCHRVVGTNGSLTGYAGGIDKKISLLTHEGIDMNKYFVPKKGTAL